MQYISIKRIKYSILVTIPIVISLLIYNYHRDRSFSFKDFCEKCTTLDYREWRLIDEVQLAKNEFSYFYIKHSGDTVEFLNIYLKGDDLCGNPGFKKNYEDNRFVYELFLKSDTVYFFKADKETNDTIFIKGNSYDVDKSFKSDKDWKDW